MENARKHRLRNFVIGYMAVFVALAAFGYFYVDKRVVAHQSDTTLISRKAVTDLAYCDLPRITVSMSTGSSASNLPPRLRADLSLEVARKDVLLIEGYRPRLTEKLSIFLAGISPDDLQRTSSLHKLRADMLKAINSADSPVPVHDLLFRELVIM